MVWQWQTAAGVLMNLGPWPEKSEKPAATCQLRPRFQWELRHIDLVLSRPVRVIDA